jgi:hypothetical protein
MKHGMRDVRELAKAERQFLRREAQRCRSKANSSSPLTWQRDGDDWVLLAGRRRFGRVVPAQKHAGMWRSLKSDGQLSDMSNLSWAKNALLLAAQRDLEWEGRQQRAITPSKSQQIAPVFESRSSPMRFSVSGVST